MTKSVKKIVILLVAMLMCATVVFAACNKANFTPVNLPADGEVDSNGGIAVRYGEWLYYVNGYTSNVSAENTYSDDVKDTPRVGSVVRIKLEELAGLFEINDDESLTSAKKSEEIAAKIREKAETVVPKVYYSANTTTTQFTGIHIFNKRIYVTTPNDKLTANGDPRTSELVLMSFDLGGGNRQEHFTFESNSAQIWLDEVGGKVVATYLMDSVLHRLQLKDNGAEDVVVTKEYGKLKHVDNKVSSVNWDKEGKAVFFLDEFGSICKLPFGESEYQVVIENDTAKDHGDHIESGTTSYTIVGANKGVVYYRVSDSVNKPSTGNVVLYWATDDAHKDNIALTTNSVSSVTGWKDGKLVFVQSQESGKKTFYSICIVERVEGANGEFTYPIKELLKYGQNDSSITINKIEGDLLYYTSDSISYVINLAEADSIVDNGEAYAKNLASTTGWAAPDFLNYGDVHYIISVSTDTVTLTKFDPSDLKSNTVSVTLTLTAKPAEDEK